MRTLGFAVGLETIIAQFRAHPKNRPGSGKALRRYVESRLRNQVASQIDYRIPTAAKSSK